MLCDTSDKNSHHVDFDFLVDHIDNIRTSSHNQAYKDASHSHRKLLSVDLDGGARAAHMWTSRPNAIPAIGPRESEKGVDTSPVCALHERAEKWSSLWRRDHANTELIYKTIYDIREECRNGKRGFFSLLPPFQRFYI